VGVDVSDKHVIERPDELAVELPTDRLLRLLRLGLGCNRDGGGAQRRTPPGLV
jgi:hypothetical protein